MLGLCEKINIVKTTWPVQSLGDPKYKEKNTEDISSNNEDLLGCLVYLFSGERFRLETPEDLLCLDPPYLLSLLLLLLL